MLRMSSLVGAAMVLGLSAGAATAQTTAPAARPAVGAATYSDAQLQSFAAASLEIDPISRALPSANDEQRTQATTQIRGILQRHSIDSATYNAIAAQAQTDSMLAARITAFQVAQQPPAPPPAQ